MTITMNDPMSIVLKRIDGTSCTLADYQGRTLLVVNVASHCIFTSQYNELEALQSQFHARGFDVLGFPCNQFGNQEPGQDSEIASFCSLKYHVSFPMFSKVEVNGAGTHPLYQWLKREAPGLFGSQAIKWNFTKFLVSKRGHVIGRYSPQSLPSKIAKAIEADLADK